MQKSSVFMTFKLCSMDNIQQIADAVQKGLQLIVRASVQQGSTRQRRLRIELCSDSFHAVLALSCGQAKCQCCITTVTVVVYCIKTEGKYVIKIIFPHLNQHHPTLFIHGIHIKEYSRETDFDLRSNFHIECCLLQVCKVLKVQLL